MEWTRYEFLIEMVAHNEIDEEEATLIAKILISDE